MMKENTEKLKPTLYRPDIETSAYIRIMMRPSDKGELQRFIDRLVCDRYEAEWRECSPQAVRATQKAQEKVEADVGLTPPKTKKDT